MKHKILWETYIFWYFSNDLQNIYYVSKWQSELHYRNIQCYYSQAINNKLLVNLHLLYVFHSSWLHRCSVRPLLTCPQCCIAFRSCTTSKRTSTPFLKSTFFNPRAFCFSGDIRILKLLLSLYKIKWLCSVFLQALEPWDLA